ncbi:branched-chain amino acid ABC transporter ATP-binding protein/permease [Epibacterium sp. Ofav1-8]|uniref:branched-chain amino acid ABC transporter ATP-binding protein/permease n=1 Tax=Epibacterium sp. Ofav1-8 TaxID=2917735 RepID=UPI001EF527F4|nr:branched-chain amino acid ABC transporter ATP-binding protein/permease [Epibacterium sp. Ofav1-8]MCG7625163.1 branched-chain amino acid ABC transporter ATP-binding protein/permease [Epibacterium sp. Ofav1-8]
MARLSLKTTNRSAALFLAIFGVAVAVFAPSYQVGLLTIVGIDTIVTLGLTMLLISGQISLGHASYMGIGAYCTAILARDLAMTPVLALVFGVAVASLACVVIGSLTMRLKGIFVPLATLSIGIAVPTAIVALDWLTGGASGFPNVPEFNLGPISSGGEGRDFAAFVWIVMLLLLLGCATLLNSRFGRAVSADAAHHDMALVFGSSIEYTRLTTFALSGALAGLGGALYAFQLNFLSVSPFSLAAGIHLLIAVVLGGIVHPFGAFLGVIAVTLIEAFLQNVVARSMGLSGAAEMMIFGVVLVAVLIKYPGGIWSVIARIWPEFTFPRSPATQATPAPAVPEVQPVHVEKAAKHFGGLKALDGVSLHIGKGEIIGLIGPNGAGKSTLFDLLCGLTIPTEGSVAILGQTASKNLTRLVRFGAARTFQHVKLIDHLTVLENVAFGAHVTEKTDLFRSMTGLDRAAETRIFDRAWDALRKTGLEELANAKTSTLSMGQARLVEIARALASNPTLLMLDEPAAGLRSGEKRLLADLLHELRGQGMSILLVEHDLEFVVSCVSRIYVLNRGTLLSSGTPQEVQNDPAVIEAYLGMSNA